MENIVELSGLEKSFSQKYGHPVKILEDINLSIAQGQTLCVLGESGCGKTTLGKIIAGLLPYNAGSYKFMGKEVSALKGKEKDYFRKSVQLIHQNPYESLNPASMVFDAIATPIKRHQKNYSISALYPQVAQLLEIVGLTPVEDFVDKYPSALSGGQRQRVSIARVLAMKPKLIVVDEATSMIDASLRISLLDTLRSIQQKLNVSYFFITHDLALGKYFSRGQKAMIMYLGHIVEEIPTDDLLLKSIHPYTKAVISAAVGSSNILEKRTSDKYTLNGTDIPSFAKRPTGCPLHNRCPQMVCGNCENTFFELYDLGGGHKTACILAKEVGK